MKRKLTTILYRLANRARRLYWFIFRPERFGIKVLIKAGHQILLVKHSYDSRWNLPGGGFNPKRESPGEAGRREVREELSLDLPNLIALGTYVSNLEYKRDNVYCLFADIESPLKITASEEIFCLEWCKLDALPKELSNAVQKAVEMLGQRNV